MRDIEIMFNDGMIGNKAILLALSTLTTGNINSKLKQGATPYKMKDVLPSVHEYIIPPISDEQKEAEKNRHLFGFMALSPGAPQAFLEGLNANI